MANFVADTARDQLLERPLPNSAESERAILGAIILDNGLINQAIELLKTEDFYTQAIAGGAACFVHGLFPFLCVTTGSRTIRALAARLGGAQRRHATVIRTVIAARPTAPVLQGAAVESLNSSAL